MGGANYSGAYSTDVRRIADGEILQQIAARVFCNSCGADCAIVASSVFNIIASISQSTGHSIITACQLSVMVMILVVGIDMMGRMDGVDRG